MTGLGTFAEMMTVAQHSVVKVESDLPDEQLALIGCGVTTGVGAALNTARVATRLDRRGHRVRWRRPGRHPGRAHRRRRAHHRHRPGRAASATRRCKLGATDVIDPSDADPIEAVRALSGGRGADYAFEVIGTAGTIRQAVETARPGGTTVMVGVPQARLRRSAIPAMSVLEEKTILGCVYGSAQVRRDFPRLISLIEQGKLDVGAMVTRTMHLHEVNEAIRRHAGRRGHPQRPRLIDQPFAGKPTWVTTLHSDSSTSRRSRTSRPATSVCWTRRQSSNGPTSSPTTSSSSTSTPACRTSHPARRRRLTAVRGSTRDQLVAFVSASMERVTTVHHGHMPEISLVDRGTATGHWGRTNYCEYEGADGSLHWTVGTAATTTATSAPARDGASNVRSSTDATWTLLADRAPRGRVRLGSQNPPGSDGDEQRGPP